MARLTDKRPYFPPTPTPRPFATGVRVARPFTHERLEFRVGDVLSPNSPLVHALVREYPDYFERATYH